VFLDKYRINAVIHNPNTTKDTSVLNASPHWTARHKHEGSADLLVAMRLIGIMASTGIIACGWFGL